MAGHVTGAPAQAPGSPAIGHKTLEGGQCRPKEQAPSPRNTPQGYSRMGEICGSTSKPSHYRGSLGAMATYSGRSYDSLLFALLQGEIFPQASGGVGAKEGDLRPPWCFEFHPSKITNRRIPSTVDKFEPPSEVSNSDRTATIQGAQVPRC